MSHNSANMFSGYNKTGTGGARVGNWVEELALQDATGSTRYEDFRDRGKPSTTPARVVAHSDQQHPKDYIGASKTGRPDRNVEYKKVEELGPRAQARQARMRAQVQQMAAEKPEVDQTDYTSANSAAYIAYDSSAFPKKQPRGGGGDKLRTGAYLDPDTKAMGKTKAQVEKEDDAIIGSANYTKAQPISIYTEMLRNGDGAVVGTAAGGNNMFGRSTAFTNDITDPTKRHVGAADFGGTEPVRIGPNLTQKAAFDKVRGAILARGANGIKGVARVMRIMDDNGNKKLNIEEFWEGLREYGLELDDRTLRACFGAFDTDGIGFISFDEFLMGLRGDLNARRKKMVMLAYDVLDVDGSGQVTYADIEQAYNTSQCAEVLAGLKTEEEILEAFFDQWDTDTKDGVVTKDEFIEYYKNVSASIDDDDYFELMIRNAWHISGGDGWCANTSCRRVLVTHTDLSQEVCEIKNDIGLDATDIDGMVKRLTAQGIPAIKCISLVD